MLNYKKIKSHILPINYTVPNFQSYYCRVLKIFRVALEKGMTPSTFLMATLFLFADSERAYFLRTAKLKLLWVIPESLREKSHSTF